MQKICIILNFKFPRAQIILAFIIQRPAVRERDIQIWTIRFSHTAQTTLVCANGFINYTRTYSIFNLNNEVNRVGGMKHVSCFYKAASIEHNNNWNNSRWLLEN